MNLRVFIHRPAHNHGVGVDIGGRDVGFRTDEVGDLFDEAAAEPFEFQPRKLLGIDNDSAFAAADVALAASGTVSLELAATDTPMVIAYDAAPLTRMIVQRMLLVDTVTLVNLVSETRVVPECLGPDCTPDRIARSLESVLRAPDAQPAAMTLTMDRLGKGGEPPGLRAAKAVLNRLKV